MATPAMQLVEDSACWAKQGGVRGPACLASGGRQAGSANKGRRLGGPEAGIERAFAHAGTLCGCYTYDQTCMDPHRPACLPFLRALCGSEGQRACMHAAPKPPGPPLLSGSSRLAESDDVESGASGDSADSLGAPRGLMAAMAHMVVVVVGGARVRASSGWSRGCRRNTLVRAVAIQREAGPAVRRRKEGAQAGRGTRRAPAEPA